MHSTDQTFMEMAIEEAGKGAGRTSPNPAVGAVIVRDGEVIGRGYHKKAGTPHAEVNAINSVEGTLEGATIYVTLEPCNHTGRTPPCTQAILDNKLSRVVIGMLDPNPHVAGNGVGRLVEAGVEVVSGVLENQCRELNFPFIKHITTGMPWVSMKAGLSLDGRISYRTGSGGKITGEVSHRYVHQLRDVYDAILIGVGTALIDDPSLTTRLDTGKGRDPLRIVLDSGLRLPEHAKMLNQESDAGTVIFCSPDAPLEKQKLLEAKGAAVYRVAEVGKNGLPLPLVLKEVANMGVNSVLVEGGAGVHGSFLKEDLIDQFYLFYAPFFIGEQGTPLLSGFSQANREGATMYCCTSSTALDKDTLVVGYRHQPFV